MCLYSAQPIQARAIFLCQSLVNILLHVLLNLLILIMLLLLERVFQQQPLLVNLKKGPSKLHDVGDIDHEVIVLDSLEVPVVSPWLIPFLLLLVGKVSVILCIGYST